MLRATSLTLLLAFALSGCDVTRDGSKQDTTTVAPSAAGDTMATPPDSLSGVPAVPADTGAGAADTGVVRLGPDRAQRGGIVAALAEGAAATSTRCSWKGSPLPCYAAPGGVLALVPLPADEPPGTYILSFEYPNRRIARSITVGDRDFGRELIFLDDSLWRDVRQQREIARDARVLQRALSAESPRRLWSGRWREPIEGSRSSGYGVERFYFRATDSTRAIALESSMRTSGSFGVDSSAGRDVPGWRHAGIDIPARRGSPVRAPAPATVATTGSYLLTGRTLLLDHGQGVQTAYFHLDTILVREGDEVPAGRVIARVGSSGLATGPHLHYGIYVHGKDVDPAQWAKLPEFARDTTGTRR